MAYYRTCKNCIREAQPCPIRDSLKASLARLSVTSIKHRCGERVPAFAAGQRVAVTWPVDSGDGEYGPEYTDETWSATVIKESGSRFLIKVDDAESDYETPAKSYLKNPDLVARPTAARLRPLDEPARTVCATCARVGAAGFGEDGCIGYPSKVDGFGFRPHGCAALKSLSEAPRIDGDDR